MGDLFGGVGESIKGVLTDAVNAMMKAIWDFAMLLLGGSLKLVDEYTTPNVDPTNGPLAGVLPATIWVGLVVLVLMAFLQIGKSVVRGGRGFGRIFIGLAQYVVISVGGLTVLAAMLTASNAVAVGILDIGLDIDKWQGINGKNSGLSNATNTVSGVGLGLIALLCVIPAALGFLLEGIARNAAILILAATIPILAAGLISDSTRRWFWTGLRWMLALVLMPPGVALAITIGMRLATGAAGAEGQQQGAVQAIVSAVVAGIVLIIALTTPLALYKLFAFVDPTSLSGSAVRGFFAGGGSGGSGGGGTAASSEGGAESTSEGRFGQALAGLGGSGMSNDGAQMASTGSAMLDAVGAGHPGGPSGGNGGGDGSSGGSSSGEDDSSIDSTPPDQESSPGASGGDDGSDSGSTPAAPGGNDGSGAPGPGQGASTDSASPPTPAAGQDGSESSQGGGGGGVPSPEGGDGGQPPAPPGQDGQDPPTGGGGGGGGGPKGGGGGAAAGGEAAEAAVVVA